MIGYFYVVKEIYLMLDTNGIAQYQEIRYMIT